MAKILDDVATDYKEDSRFMDVEKKLSSKVSALPNISPKIIPHPKKERRNSSVSMPIYVWDLIADKAHAVREPQNIFIMKALKQYGIDIDESDLVDPRKVRYEAG